MPCEPRHNSNHLVLGIRGGDWASRGRNGLELDMNFTPMLMDETRAECAERVRTLEMPRARNPRDQDAHVSAWIVEKLIAAYDAAEQRRRTKYDKHTGLP